MRYYTNTIFFRMPVSCWNNFIAYFFGLLSSVLNSDRFSFSPQIKSFCTPKMRVTFFFPPLHHRILLQSGFFTCGALTGDLQTVRTVWTAFRACERVFRFNEDLYSPLCSSQVQQSIIVEEGEEETSKNASEVFVLIFIIGTGLIYKTNFYSWKFRPLSPPHFFGLASPTPDYIHDENPPHNKYTKMNIVLKKMCIKQKCFFKIFVHS